MSRGDRLGRLGGDVGMLSARTRTINLTLIYINFYNLKATQVTRLGSRFAKVSAADLHRLCGVVDKDKGPKLP